MKYILQITISLLIVFSINAHGHKKSVLDNRMKKADSDAASCWIRTTSIGVGRPFSGCGSNPLYPEKLGLLCYKACKQGERRSGLMCIGKRSYISQSVILGCPKGTYNNNSLCYKKRCSPNTKQVGPICWGNCPSSHINCFGLCLLNETCTDRLISMVKSVFSTVNNAIANLAEDTTIDIVKFGGSLHHPLCATSGPRR
jgi:hypothetical protein